MFRFAAAIVFCASVSIGSRADEPTKWEPPAPPMGWEAVAGKDGSYQFFVPKGIGRSGTRDRNYTINGVRVRSSINYYLLKDGTTLEVEATSLSGPRLTGVKASDVIDAVVEGAKEEGFKVSDPKEVTAGPNKGKEYRLTKDKSAQRTIFFFARPRFFVLTVATDDPAKLDTETANTFTSSLALVPADILKARAKERAAKNEQTGKENLEKYGVKWTMNLKEMTPPDAPVLGVIRGKEFRPDSVTVQFGRLVFRQGGTDTFADIEVEVSSLARGRESVENKTFEVTAAATASARSPHVRLAMVVKSGQIPQTELFSNKFALKLTFGAKDSDGTIPGSIYLCTPDTGRSFLAGKFTAVVK